MGVKNTFIFILIILLCANVASAETKKDISSYENAQLNLKIHSTIHSDAKSNANLKTLTAEVTNFPEDNEFLKVISINTEPEISSENTFEWTTIQDKYPFEINALIQTTGNEYNIDRKISYPLRNLPDEIQEYKRPTKHIDSDNKEMRTIASELVQGKDDLFDIAFTLAKWTHDNVEYDLSTLTAEANMPASWVLEHRRGVCDELTNLYVAMLRSIGIPARVVVGIAYTDSELFDYNWGPHAWAEVYFPGVGWVPFDVTYEQFGYIDSGHIKLADDYDAKTSSLKYSWYGSGITFSSDPLRYDVSVIGFDHEQDYPLELDMEFYDTEVRIGSYNMLEINVKNEGDTYLPYRLYISNTESLKYYDSNNIFGFLEPYEEKTYYRMIKVSDELNRGYIYTFPVSVNTDKGTAAREHFTVTKSGTFYSYNDIYIPEDETKENNVYLDNIEFSCEPENNKYLEGEEIIIDCKVQNTGNRILENINTCLDECVSYSLALDETKNIQFKPKAKIGLNEFEAVTNFEITKMKSLVHLEVFDKPQLSIDDIDILSENRYGGNVTITFKINQESYTEPNDMSLKLIGPFEDIHWDVEDIADTQFKYETLSLLKNSSYLIELIYHDSEGNSFSERKEVSVPLTDLSIVDKVKILINRFGMGIREKPTEFSIFSGMLFFIGTTALIYKRKK